VTADPSPTENRTPGSIIRETLTSRPSNGEPLGMLKAGGQSARKSGYRGLELWLHRIAVLMFVFVCAVVGVLLIILPWRPEWTDNRLLLFFPALRAIVSSGFVRGLCSGLGLLDIWIGFWEAVHYQEVKC